MADLPITFSGPMVRALLREIEQPGTGKTQTRRVMKNVEAVGNGTFHIRGAGGGAFGITEERIPEVGPDYARIATGDRLYVREHWRTAGWLDDISPRNLSTNVPLRFEADPVDVDNLPLVDGRFRQAMHMPKWASRITLLVTDVRVERLQDCSEADAIAEGIEPVEIPGGRWKNYQPDRFQGSWLGAVNSYMTLWDSISGKGAWDRNPWVVAYTFKPILGHIDQVKK